MADRGRAGAEPWDAPRFAAELANAKLNSDRNSVKKVLAKVAEHNYRCKEFWRVPRTVPVSFQQCKEARLSPVGKGPIVSVSTMTTADAIEFFAKQKGNVVCALNFANGETPGGGYKNGAVAQEEDLCRQFPTLYSTLYKSKSDGLYPFGPCTCKSASAPEKYSDVLYTAGLTLGRASMENGYALLLPEQEVTASMVAAAAPNIRFASEISDRELIYNTVQTIFKAPRLMEEEVNTLILGAWGCGAFGGDAKTIAELFVRALMSDSLGDLYREVHFAIPKLAPDDNNYEVFVQVLKDFQIRFVDADRKGSKG
eukprot:TRINITY_DN32439_c0_g1_i1.p1 TRINITY_DN32439_c0_g1~~TRINITY_DN32439_c0_g1_i1.p1  ORF type:complete len:312 (+),score=52.78 TRINITY_DN32439_c0_g1_i1:66-1001(+)